VKCFIKVVNKVYICSVIHNLMFQMLDVVADVNPSQKCEINIGPCLRDCVFIIISLLKE
jgi:hypothetical protein